MTTGYLINKTKRFSEDGYFQVDLDAYKMAIHKSTIINTHWVFKFEPG